MDVTDDFRSLVRTKRREGGLKMRPEELMKPIKRKREETSPYLANALSILKAIKKLRQYLIQHQRDYIDTREHFSAKAGMSEKERDEIDYETTTSLKQCCQKVDELKRQIDEANYNGLTKGGHNELHLAAVVTDLYRHLEGVSDLHRKQREIRLKKARERRNSYFTRPVITKSFPTPPFQRSKDMHRSPTAPELHRRPVERDGTEGEGEGEKGDQRTRSHLMTSRKQHSFRRSTSKLNTERENEQEEDELELTETERQLLEQENIRLSKDFETLVDRTREIEKQMYEISNLHNTFATRVMEQAEAIDYNQTITVQSIAHVEKGNEHLQSASTSSRDFRVFVLLFLLICSFSLLFLHWYE